MGGYRPTYPDDWQPPAKRQKNNPPSRQRYQAERANRTPKQSNPSVNPGNLKPLNPTGNPTNGVQKHRNRKNNPSTRIHSLKNLLARGQIPHDVRQEKERELASLLFDQEKDKVAQTTKKMIKRYHMVRFIERKKAEKHLKNLRKELGDLQKNVPVAKGPDEGSLGGTEQSKVSKKARRKELYEKIHEAEVDLNYTLYSPLDQKYISIFAAEWKDPGSGLTSKKVKAIFTEEQKRELQHIQDEASNLVKSAGNVKPPIWFEVEKCMKGETNTAQKKLELLRDGKLHGENTTISQGMLSVRRKGDVGQPTDVAEMTEEQPAWLDEDEEMLMDPDLADCSDEDDEDGGMKLDGNSDEDGFFEQRTMV